MELIQIPGITPDQQLTLMAWGIGGAFIALLVAGMTNRVVIFANGKDLMWTVSIFLAPVIGLVIAGSLVPEGREFQDETAAVVVAGIGGVFALFACIMTFILAIKHNGLFVGIILGIFKVVAALLAAVCAIGLIGKIFDQEGGSFVSRIFAVVVFGFLLWVMRKLINGDEVYARREQIMSA